MPITPFVCFDIEPNLAPAFASQAPTFGISGQRERSRQSYAKILCLPLDGLSVGSQRIFVMPRIYRAHTAKGLVDKIVNPGENCERAMNRIFPTGSFVFRTQTSPGPELATLPTVA